MTQFNNFDLNLLRTLDVLLKERSVTRAAQTLHMSQSAMSHALARLRDMMGDQLLVRGANGMIATPLGEQLKTPLGQALRGMESLLSPQVFDPRTASQTFLLGTTDYVEYLIFPTLVARVRHLAPNVCLRICDITAERIRDDLAGARVDVVVSFAPGKYPQAHRRRLLTETYSCVMRSDRPGGHLTVDQYLDAPHILVSPSGTFSGVVDVVLGRIKRERNVVMSTPHYLAAAEIVARTDMVLTIQSRLARHFADYLPIRVSDPPFAMPETQLSMFWAPRTHQDSAHKWLRSLIVSTCRDLCGEPDHGDGVVSASVRR